MIPHCRNHMTAVSWMNEQTHENVLRKTDETNGLQAFESRIFR